MEVIPRTLAENAGLDPIDTLVNLRSKHESGKGDSKNFGINVFTGESVDMKKLGVVEPLRVKTQAISGASEAAVMILRIDDVIAASKLSGGAGGTGRNARRHGHGRRHGNVNNIPRFSFLFFHSLLYFKKIPLSIRLCSNIYGIHAATNRCHRHIIDLADRYGYCLWGKRHRHKHTIIIYAVGTDRGR